jgi:3-isopropylmalate/(R)-2-methylmalate dehydratase small subunit
MDKFNDVEALVVPLDRANVDTDAILPKQFMKSIKRTGFGPNLFDEWRYLDHLEHGQAERSRRLNPNFTLNQPRYNNSQILLARENFGCGSSREHAPWALRDFGISSIIAPSFAEIFYGNCIKSGLLPIVLNNSDVEELFKEVDSCPGYKLRIELGPQTVTKPDGSILHFDISPVLKEKLTLGLDDIAITLKHSVKIKAYEVFRAKMEPWLFNQTK